MKSFSNNKSPGNDGLTKNFYETFWEEQKKTSHDFVKPNKRQQKISHVPKASTNKIIRKERQKQNVLLGTVDLHHY